MRSPAQMVCKAFLMKLTPEKRTQLLRFLPEKERFRMDATSASEKMGGFGNLLELAHWSWFIPTLKTYSEREQKLFLNALSGAAAESLKQELGIDSPVKEEITEIAARFLRQILLSSLTGAHDQILPIEYLPASPLKPLAKLSKKELTRLIDYLSLYDLAAELRQIVETKILKKIYSFLSEGERKFLKIVNHHKEAFPTPRIGLDKWEGEEESFRHLLHRRGLARLAAALSGQDPDLIWYICHQLDIGRGNTLFKLCGKEAVAGVSDLIIRQIEELLVNEDIRL